MRPPGCDVLEQIARTVNPTARVWRGSGVPTEQQGMKILGTPLGHPDFVWRHLAELAAEQRLLLERIPCVKDVQGAWLLLVHCASARANYFLRSVRPEAVAEYAGLHDAGFVEVSQQNPPSRPLHVWPGCTRRGHAAPRSWRTGALQR